MFNVNEKFMILYDVKGILYHEKQCTVTLLRTYILSVRHRISQLLANNLEKQGGVTCIQHCKPISWCCMYVVTFLPLIKYAQIALSQYEGAYLLSMVTVRQK